MRADTSRIPRAFGGGAVLTSELDTELPPLDEPGDAETDEGPALDELGEMLDLESEADVDLDDEEATDLDIGVTLDDPEEEAGEGRGEIVLDIAELLAFDDAPALGDDDDAEGLEGLDPSIGIEEPAGSMLGDAEEGVTDPVEDLVEENLPGLDADAEGDFEEPVWAEADAFADDELAAPAAKPWSVTRLLHDDVSALAVSAGAVFAAAGLTLWRIGPGFAPERSVDLDDRIDSMALSSQTLSAWCLRGQLLCVQNGRAEVSHGLLSALGLKEGELAHADLAAPGHRRLLALARGRLLESQDGGRSFVQALAGEWTTLARSGRAVLGRGTLRITADEGVSWRERLLDSHALAIARGDHLLVESDGRVVVLADSRRGLCVARADAGFQRAGGAPGVRALALARIGERPCLLIAASSGLDATVSVVRIELDTLTAEVVCELGPESGEEWPEDRRVSGMVWDGRALWLAGAFGLARCTPG